MRTLQHHIAMNQILFEMGTIPLDLIQEVFDKVQNELRKEVKPVIYKVKNPKAAVWEGNVELDEISLPFPFPENRRPFIFIHGAFNKQNKETAFDFFKPFENEVKLFYDPNLGYSDVDVYILSYDTELTDEYEWSIRKGFEMILGPITDPEPNPAPDLFAAVFWHELMKRAEEVGAALVPFLKGISESVLINKIGRGTIVTHSLGCHVFAHAAQSFINESSGTTDIFSEWLCMAAAIPMGALSPGGKYSDANKVLNIYADSLEVYYSKLDSLLSTVYFAATGTLAIGQTGALAYNSNINDIDVTIDVNVTHRVKDGYFEKLGQLLYYKFHPGDGA
ncbi:hypothetical protein [Metabacillus elymi]|uniref:Alpha/beta hydrolase n=1 Tax=Metabacillus elymi TaxID=2745198 RepID=A0ABX6S3D9_9BACI|nr:hypothetical protein [Metabacillus sp. KUDC1714]QNF28519.1 hypothetical protein HUW50_14145 [Metabacillus sp. KUDC1714]